MKKILFVLPSLNNGGTITSLRNLLSLSDLSQYKVDIFPITNSGDNYDILSKYATILGISIDGKYNNCVKKSFLSEIKILIFKVVKKIKKILCNFKIDISPLVFKYTVHKLQGNGYDIVIAYQEGQPTRFVQYFNNVKKIAWVHCEYQRYMNLIQKDEYFLYSQYDRVVCVSNTAKNSFISVYPTLEDRISIIYNCLDIEKIYKLSRIENIKYDQDVFNIISIGRIDIVKRFSEIPIIAAFFKEKNIKFIWRIIGGCANKDEYDLLVYRIKQYRVDNEILLLGEKNNPYPYIKNSQLLVSLSSSETFNYTITEARALGVPVLAVGIPSVYEFVKDNENGIISTLDDVAKKIEDLINDKILYTQIIYNLENYIVKNEGILQFEKLINSI